MNRLLKDSKDERLEFFATKKIYDDTINRLTQDLNNMKNKTYTPENSLRSSDPNLEEHVNALEMELALLRLGVNGGNGSTSGNDAFESSTTSLRLQLEDAMTKNVVLESEAGNYANEVMRLSSEVEHLVASEAELRVYSEELFAELETFVATNSELEKSLEIVQTECDQLKHELAIKAVELEEMQIEQNSSSNPASPFHSRNTAATPDSRNGRSSPVSREFKFNSRVLEVKLKDEQDYNIQLKRELTKVRAEMKNLEDQLHTAGMKNVDLEQQVEELTKEVDDCRKTISKLEEKGSRWLPKTDNSCYSLFDELRLESSSDNGSSTEIDILTTKLAGANTHNSTLQKELDEYKEKCKILERKLRSDNCSLEKADDASLLMSSLNSFSQLKWTTSGLSSTVNFLDITVAINANGKISTKTYQKPTNLHLYIPPTSAHPPGVLKSLIFGNLQRYWLQNTYTSDFVDIAKQFANRLVARGYKKHAIKQLFNEAAKKLDKVIQQRKPNNDTLYLHWTWHPRCITKSKLRLLYKNTLQEHSGFSNLIICYSRPKNLRDSLMQTKLNEPEGQRISDLLHQKQHLGRGI
jgi:chromosome segregation ATPase